jgi:heptosyltransferase-1
LIRQANELPPAPRSVLIIKPSALGDVVTALPVLRALKRTHPSARASWLVSTRCAALIAHDSQLDEAVLFDRRRLGRAWRSPSAAGELAEFLWRLARGGYDWVIDLQGLARSGIFACVSRAPVRAGFADAREGAQVFYNCTVRPDAPHTVDRNIALARRLGLDARPQDMTLEISRAGESFAEGFCRRSGMARGSFVICSAPTTWPTKLYPVRHWRTVVRELAATAPVVLIGAQGDRQLCAQIAEDLPAAVTDLSGQTTVDQMVALIAASGGVVCCDSAAKFVAPAVGVSCVALLGPTKHASTGPYLRGSALVADVPCQGCLKKRCGHITCMQTIEPGEVVSAAKAMLRG